MASRSLATRVYVPVASSSRTFASTSTYHAAAKKRSPSEPPPKRKIVAGFSKKTERTAVAGGGGTRHGKLVKLNFAMSAEPPNLSELTPLHPENVRQENMGRPTVIPPKTFETLRSFGLPRYVEQELTSLGQPASVIRQATIDMAKLLQESAGKSSEDSRYLLSGQRGSGKSFLLCQTVCQALGSGWIVLYFPKTAQWIDSSAPYEYNSETQVFDQPTTALNVLKVLLKVNGDKLSKITVSNTDGNRSLVPQTLAELIKSHMKEDKAVEGLKVVMEALGKQTDAPVLLAFDDVHTLFMSSKYRAPDYSFLEAYSLSTPLLLLDYISGRKAFDRGMVLSAPSYSHPEYYPSPTFEHALKLPSQRHLHAYEKLDPTHYAHASAGIKKIEIPYGMTTQEAAGMYDIWARKGLVRRSTDETFMGAYAGAAGNPKEMKRAVDYSISAMHVSPAGY